MLTFMNSKGVRSTDDTVQLGSCLRRFLGEKSYMLKKDWNPKFGKDKSHMANSAKELIGKIVSAHDGLTDEDLCTGGQCFQGLPLPSLHKSCHSPALKYDYMARPVFKQLFMAIGSRQSGMQEVVFGGQPGVGKSVVFATMAGYLFALFHKERYADQSSRSRRVTYSLAQIFVIDRVWCLRNALLVTFADNDSAQQQILQLADDVFDFIHWLRERKRDKFYLLVDKYNEIEGTK